VRLSPLVTSAINWPTVPAADETRAVGGFIIGRGNRGIRRKPAPEPLCPPQIPYDLVWDRRRAAEMRNQQYFSQTAENHTQPHVLSINTADSTRDLLTDVFDQYQNKGCALLMVLLSLYKFLCVCFVGGSIQCRCQVTLLASSFLMSRREKSPSSFVTT
jgi:hypothetical protein